MRLGFRVAAVVGAVIAGCTGCAKGAEDDGTASDDASAPLDDATSDAGARDAVADTAWPGIDTGLDAPPPPPDDATSDAGDATPVDASDGGCTSAPLRIPLSGVDSFQSPVDPHWAAVGSADIGVTLTGWTLLTPDQGSKAGALWWNGTYLFDHFEVTFSFQIDNKSSGADGMAFAWVPGADVTKVGGSGGGFGFTGLGGWAVAIDTYQNSGEPNAPFLSVLDATGTQLTKAAIPNVRDGTTHGMRVAVQAGAVTVAIDGTTYVSAFPIVNYAPFVGHWGFTAGTGSQSERHFVTGIAMSFPDGQGCPGDSAL